MSKQSSSVRGALQPGTVLREYRIEAVLGYGGYGVVYRARHAELGHEVAIKEYLPADLSVREAGTVYPRSPDCMQVYEDGKRRFLEEAKRIVQFKTDPGVVTCTDFFRANGTAYLVMEYIDGLSLAALLKERETAGRAFDEDDLKSVAVPLLETLLRLHRAGVLHRDIKPSNILIRRSDGQPVLIDFGAAKQMTADYTKSAAPYTEGYAAFEQVGEGELGPWTDMYAFGAVLWRMVAGGKPPWEPPNPKRVELRVAAEMAGTPDPQPSAAELGEGRFSDKLLSAIDRSLTISADKRPRDLEDLRNPLNGPSQSGDMPEPPSDSVPDPRSPSDWLIVAWAAVCVVLMIGVWVIDGITSDRSELPESDVSTNERVRSESVLVEQPRSDIPPVATATSPVSTPKSGLSANERIRQRQASPEHSLSSNLSPSVPSPASLFANCEKIDVLQVKANGEYTEIDIRSFTETWLRSANLLSANLESGTNSSSSQVKLRVEVAENREIQVSLYKQFGGNFRPRFTSDALKHSSFDEGDYDAITLEMSWKSVASSDEDIREKIGSILDYCIAEYLRINRESCTEIGVKFEQYLSHIYRFRTDLPTFSIFTECNDIFVRSGPPSALIHGGYRMYKIAESRLRSSGLFYDGISDGTRISDITTLDLILYRSHFFVIFRTGNLLHGGARRLTESEMRWRVQDFDDYALNDQEIERYLSIIIDQLISDYLRINRDSCASRVLHRMVVE